jgi:hypothetical protein
MAGRNTAAAMLAAGKNRVTPSGITSSSAEASEVQAPPAPIREETRQPVAQYEKGGFFITPDQRRWVKDVVRAAAIEGLSTSDVVRLALARLQADAGDDLDLTAELIDQAYREAEQFPGRKNRGLPPRQGSAA